MKLSEFSYALPPELIAQEPLKNREQARLLVIDRQAQTISHSIFSELAQFLPDKSLIVVNDSKVIPSRLLGRRATGGEVEIFLLKRLGKSNRYEAMLRPLARLKTGEQIHFGKVVATIEDLEKRIVSFNTHIEKHLEKIGHMPLPPYIKRPDNREDRRDYQTVYARKDASVAAPTAGLHFTPGLLKQLKAKGHELAKVTLHVGQATFKPVEAETIEDHPMHFEDYEMQEPVMRAATSAKKQGRAIAAVGTTSCRVLETFAQNHKLRGSTNLFIYPGYQFKMTDILITNFHLPASTLLMLVYAFGGTELMKRAYQEAIEKRYRFYSYGDAMWIL